MTPTLAALTALLLGCLIFLLIVAGIAASNAWALRRLASYSPAPNAPLPFVSILVPARNEAANIAACVRSLLAQDYAAFEVVALDDASTDDTGAILHALAAEAGRLRVLCGQPLPAGWLGKHWACAQLAEAARGEVFLFTDADTQHAPGALRAAVAARQQTGVDLLSALPHQETVSWGERLVVPVLGWSLFCFLPLAFAHRRQWPALSASIGQFMLIGRAGYARAGGHAGVRAHAADDLALTRRLLAAGGRWRLVDAGELVRCRMYHNLGEASEGFGKNLYAAFDYRAGVFLFIWLWIGVAFLTPVGVLTLGVLGAPWPPLLTALAAAGTALGWSIWAGFALRFNWPLRLSLTYPGIVFMAVALALRSLTLTRAGRATWKGRVIAAPRGRPG